MPLKISVELTPTQIEEAIAFYLAAQGLTVKSTYFSCTLKSEDYFERGSGTPILQHATVQVTPKDTSRSFGSLAHQIESVEAYNGR